jgi:TPR repeat protein
MHQATMLTAAMLFVSGSAIAGPLEDANAVQKKGDYAAALEILRPLAEQGDAEAQLRLGVMSIKGQGTPANLDGAQTWFKRAAENPAASKETRADAIYNRDFVSKKLKEWASDDAAAAARQQAAQAVAARQIQASRDATAATQRLQELREENERTRLRIVKQEQKENARRREQLDAEIARRNAAIDQAGANYWDDRAKARTRANGGTGF